MGTHFQNTVKRNLLIIMFVVLCTLVVGILQIFHQHSVNSTEAADQRRGVTADLRTIHQKIQEAKMAKRESPLSLAEILGSAPLNYAVTDYRVFWGAENFEPLVVYNGPSKWINGYCVFANGIVNNGKVGVSESREQAR